MAATSGREKVSTGVSSRILSACSVAEKYFVEKQHVRTARKHERQVKPSLLPHR